LAEKYSVKLNFDLPKDYTQITTSAGDLLVIGGLVFGTKKPNESIFKLSFGL
jgi:hypothetical protein